VSPATDKSFGLLPDSNDLNHRAQNRELPFTFEIYGQLSSTQTFLLDQPLEQVLPGRTVITYFQTAGRGRLNREWQAPAGSGLMMSTALLIPPSLTDIAPYLIGLAAHQAMVRLAPAVRLKWPNDIVVVVNDELHKLGGLIAHVRHTGNEGSLVVAGLGINIDLGAERPTRLAADLTDLGVRDISIADLALDVCSELRSLMPLRRYEILDLYRSQCLTLGKEVSLHLGTEAEVRGRAIDIDESGALVVQTEGEQIRVTSADVRHVR
jgi:BirA family biotin operon repressor/biotin-[acetyl-CoA-carboxylase] ligase